MRVKPTMAQAVFTRACSRVSLVEHFGITVTYLGVAYSPAREEGWLRKIRKCREATAAGADGVVAHKQRFGMSDHPVAPLKEAPQHSS
jgi:hypothetical protein